MTEIEASNLLLIRQNEEAMELLREQVNSRLVAAIGEFVLDAACARAEAGQSREQINTWLEEMEPVWRQYRDDAFQNILRDLFGSAQRIIDGTVAEVKTATVH
ncbi:hypothetical protein [Bradyrhizobium sp. LA6.12]|uniref:hypothetical protein n=1 Tax=unclassified Bradyrhizobium TaxID=2631580 RepID=UPI0033994B9A